MGSNLFFKRLRNRARIYLSSSYVKNIAVLATGTGIGQLIGILTSPVVRRLFSPENYGVFAVITSLTSLLLPLISLGYIQAIMLPKDKLGAIRVIALCARISFLLISLILLIFLFFSRPIAISLGIKEYSYFLYFIPVFLLGRIIYMILYNFNSREKLYKQISASQIYQSVSGPVVNIIMGLLNFTKIGLFIGNIFSNWIGIGRLLKSVDRDFLSQELRNKSALFGTLKRYKRFPLFGLPATLANVASVQVIDIFLSVSFSVGLLGQYAFGKLLLNLPLVFMGKSISQVYYQQSVENKKNNTKNLKLFAKTVGMLVLISIPMFLIMYFLIEDVVRFVYGEKWLDASKMMKVLMPFFAMRFVSSSVSNTLFTYEKQNFNLYINITLLIAVISLIFFSQYLNFEFMQFLVYYTIVFTILYFLFILLYYFIIKSNDAKISK